MKRTANQERLHYAASAQSPASPGADRRFAVLRRLVRAWRQPRWWSVILITTVSLAVVAGAQEWLARNSSSVAREVGRDLTQRLRAPDLQRLLSEPVNGIPLHPGRLPGQIPSIDHPLFEKLPDNDRFLAADDRVIGVYHNDVTRAYPLWILGLREIVNDRIGVEAICVTYCALSASAVVFRARTGNHDLTFGNAGSLYECNLVLYDHQTHSLWYQLRGTAIAGPHDKARLEIIPAPVVRWADWRARFPDTVVLVGDRRSGGFFRTLGASHLELSPHASAPAAPVSRTDTRLPLVQPVVGLSYDGRHLCFVPDDPDDHPNRRLLIPGTDMALTVQHAGGILSVLAPDGARLPAIGAYWFTWHAAFPESELATFGSH